MIDVSINLLSQTFKIGFDWSETDRNFEIKIAVFLMQNKTRKKMKATKSRE